MGKKKFLVISWLMFTISALLFCYSPVGSWWNSRLQSEELSHYTEVASRDPQMERVFNEAVNYTLSTKDRPLPVEAPVESMYSKEYLSQLVSPGLDTIGRVVVPSASIDLPVYHGTSNAVLDKGVGHLYGTALPVGVDGKFSLLSAHTGLPTHRMFSDLPKVKVGDKFYVMVAGRTGEYTVTETVTLSPEEAAKRMQPKDGVSQVALITCTPWAVNTSRFIAFGEFEGFLPPDSSVVPKEGLSEPFPWWVIPVIVIVVVSGVAVALKKE